MARDPGSVFRRHPLRHALTTAMSRAGTMPEPMEWPAAQEDDEEPPEAD